MKTNKFRGTRAKENSGLTSDLILHVIKKKISKKLWIKKAIFGEKKW